MVKILCSLLIWVFASFAIETFCQNASPASPCTNENLYGPNMNCYLLYDVWVKPSYLKTKIPNAVPYGLAHLPKYRLAFDKENWYTTIVPDSAEDLWGYTYLTPVSEYETYLNQDMKLENGDIVEYAIAVTVDVTKTDGTTVSAQCNAFALIKQPPIQDPVPEDQKPPQDDLEDTLNSFHEVGIPQDYIDKIKTRYTKQD